MRKEKGRQSLRQEREEREGETMILAARKKRERDREGDREGAHKLQFE